MLVVNLPNATFTVEKPLFPLGELLIAEATLDNLGIDNIIASIKRHLNDNWGDITANERITNEQAVKKAVVAFYRFIRLSTE